MISDVRLGNCMDFMREFPDGYFELAIVDPPYGIGASKNTKYSDRKFASFTNYKKKHWDEKIPDENYFYELFRVSEKQIIWGGNYFNLPTSPSWIIWDKMQPDGVHFAPYELAYNTTGLSGKIFRMSSSYNNGGNSSDRISKTAKARIHPTQKPIALYKWLLKNYAKPGDKILDTHLGSGSSRIAAHDMGFDFYGYELDADYFAAQEERFQRHIKQGQLFVPQQQYGQQISLLDNHEA